MIVVCCFKLIFNKNRFPGEFVFADNITTVTPYKLFRINICK